MEYGVSRHFYSGGTHSEIVAKLPQQEACTEGVSIQFFGDHT